MTSKQAAEWFRQARYDFGTARAMFRTRRYVYAIFMCHLAAEKTLKGLYAQKVRGAPPRTHDLIYLAKIMNLSVPNDLQEFLNLLNDLSVPTRYPDNISKARRHYTRARTADVLSKTKGLLSWLTRDIPRSSAR